MIYIIYIVIASAVTIAFSIVFNSSLNISFIPLFFIAFMILMSLYFYTNRKKSDFNVNNNSELSEEEWETVSVYMSRSLIIFLPFNFPLIFFFNLYVKVISMVIITVVALISGPVFYKVKNKNR